MPTRRDLRQRLATLLEMPSDLMVDAARITIVGDMEVLVDNHRGLVEYTEEQVSFGSPQGRICIVGMGLEIALISPEGALIKGRIREVRYTD